MAEITDFPERRDQISIAADEIGKELKKMQGFKTVGPENERLIEIFGGRKIPRKFTFAHMQELLKGMSPIAGDENTIFTLSQIIEEKFPGTIDKKDFASFEERFSSVLDTQDAGNLVDLPANDAGKKVAEPNIKDFDVRNLTLREAATIYANEVANSGKGLAPNATDGGRTSRANFVSASVRLAGEIADEPGSALALFAPDEDGKTGIGKLLEGLPEEDTNVKSSMMNLRLIGHHVLKKGLAETDPAYATLPDSAAKSSKNEKIFGRLEPKKAESLIAINPDEDVQREFFSRLAAKTGDPAQRKSALAAMFLLNTGLRSEVIEQLEPHHYNAKKGALYIPGNVAGTKGNPVNIPLNPMADAIIQEFIQERQNLGLGSDADGKNRIFFKLGSRSQKGSNLPQVLRLRTQDVTDVMRDIKIDDLTYDVKTDTFYDSLSPEGLSKQVKSGSRLLRNIHATLGEALGIPDHRIAYLEGRSTKSIRKNVSTGALEVYQVAFPFAISKLDRDHASVYSGFFIDSAEVSGLNFSQVLDMQKTRVFADTPGYEGYFDKPIQEAPTKVSMETEKPAPTSPADFDDDTKAALKKGGFNIDYSKLPSRFLGPLGLGLTTAAAVTTGTAVRQRAEAMGIPDPLAKTAGVVAGASEFLPVPPSDVAEVQPDPFSMRPVERAAAESEVVREGLKTTGQLQEAAPRETRKAAPAPIDDSFLTMSP